MTTYRTIVADPTRKCGRHDWHESVRVGEEAAWTVAECRRCGKVRDEAVTRRNRNNKARGGREERTVANMLGGTKVGPLGLPHDVVVEGYLRLQVKQLDRWPSLARVIDWLDAMKPGSDVRGVTVADTPGLGGRTRRLLIVDLDEYARWHGVMFEKGDAS